MPWLKIDDGMWSNPKWLTVSPSAKALWLFAASYSSDKLTDGIMRPIDWQVVAIHVGVTDWQPLVAELEAHRFLDPGPDGTTVIHDYLKYNPSRADVQAEREATRKRMCALRSGAQNANTINPVPSRPVPIVCMDVAEPLPPQPEDDDPASTLPISDQRKLIALLDVGINHGMGAEFAQRCTLQRIQDVIAYAKGAPGLKSPTALIVKMLRSGEAIPKPSLPANKGPGKRDASRESHYDEASLERQRAEDRGKVWERPIDLL